MNKCEKRYEETKQNIKTINKINKASVIISYRSIIISITAILINILK